jgi:hypothetical protein
MKKSELVSLSAGFDKHVTCNIRSAIAMSIVNISVVTMTTAKAPHTFSSSETQQMTVSYKIMILKSRIGQTKMTILLKK